MLLKAISLFLAFTFLIAQDGKTPSGREVDVKNDQTSHHQSVAGIHQHVASDGQDMSTNSEAGRADEKAWTW
ncbi:hypothetical protein H1R20_g10537, partial [Candolleomyces eurysporus]